MSNEPRPDDAPTPDEVWRLLTHVVIDTRDQWKRAVVERTGMPFSRIRVLKRLRKGAMTVSELARAAAMDAPAATVTVNDLEERGLVVREVDPTNRRSKLVSITDAGRAVLADALGTPDPAPEPLVDLPADELSALHEILRKLEH
ncbi:MarR family winged helix-turn-helix transcriptional regulator [Nocardia terpenica]|uniref:MarR family transcriptional regulator n=1 Tax=Nocardia terpenica TaxID=455432 RepID=A0A164MAZ7_9NOCA|nr:MarR family transcriptional regulator [Nocardia terpenica]KZM73202.1 MarR family transcriptional regulator [Nocardia terpenica]